MNPIAQDGAIGNDVPDEDQNRQLTPRELAMEAISQKNRANLEAELGVKLSESDEDTQLAEQLAEPEPVPAPVPVVQKFKANINGVEEEVDTDTLVRSYQKNRAADQRLEQATQLLREAEQQAAELREQAKAPTPAAAPVTTPDELRTQAADLLDKMYDGDKEAATDAFLSLLAQAKGGDQPTPTPTQAVVDEDALAAKVLDRMSVQTAFDKIKTDYPELITDPDLEQLTALKITRAVQAGIPRAEAMLSAANEVYKTLGKEPAGRQPDPVPPPASTRMENKKRLDNVPVASASAIPPEAPKEGNPSSVIAEMASRRLGQSLPQRAN